ncbi:hypothetical protein BGX26_004446 [Mortierella sp. AD094]|nr:hypothetical protein BGX26_004446 [Mortierella sp. AD094]
MSSSYPSYPWTPTTSTVLPGGIISGVPTSAVTSTPSNGSSSQNFTASPTGSTPASYPSSSPTFVPNAGPGISVQTVLSTIGLVCLIVATVYTIHVIRRDRRLRRLLERENGGQDLESNSGGGARLTSTYRPEDEDPASPPPPQYRVYGGDQPYIDPEMVVVYPDMVFLNNNSALESVSSQRGLIGTASAMTAGDLNEPITTTTTTTITTTTTTMTCSSPPSTSSMNPVVSGTTITAPSPVITLTAGSHWSVFDKSQLTKYYRVALRFINAQSSRAESTIRSSCD